MKLHDEGNRSNAGSDLFAGDPGKAERLDLARGVGARISRRMAVGGVAFFGPAMSALSSRAFAQPGASGSYSDAAIAVEPPGASAATSDEDLVQAVKIARAMRSGPLQITRDATVAEMDSHGNIARILRSGTNGWICMPGDENRIGDPPMCVDELGMQWFKDAMTGQPRPTNRAPGLCYMLCGATQHSNTDHSDKTSAAIPIGPHWMLLWPFDPTHCGLPTTVRDAGAWIMFAGTPYAYLHICGTPWDGNEYSPGDEAVWTMQYSKRHPG
jgi:hypothetical protein